MPKVEKDEQNIKDCSCPNCPSYNECAENKKETVFCAERSACEFKMQGCLCSACAVYERNGLAQLYYCVKGTAEEID